MSTTSQVQEFLRFFSGKRDLVNSELDAVFRDNKDTRLMDDMFSKDEVENMLDGLLVDTQDTVRKELEKTTRMSALVVEQLLTGASAAGTELTVDMSKAEDERMLARVGSGDPALREADMKLKASAVKLDSIRDEHSRTVADLQRLRDENKTLTDRYQTMQARATTAVKEVSDLNQQITRLESELERERARPSESAVSVMKGGVDESKVAELEDRIRRLTRELSASEEERKELEDKLASTASSPTSVPVSQTKQFRQLKEMLQKKSQQLTTVRRKLAKYEPDDADELDEREVPTGK